MTRVALNPSHLSLLDIVRLYSNQWFTRGLNILMLTLTWIQASYLQYVHIWVSQSNLQLEKWFGSLMQTYEKPHANNESNLQNPLSQSALYSLNEFWVRVFCYQKITVFLFYFGTRINVHNYHKTAARFQLTELILLFISPTEIRQPGEDEDTKCCVSLWTKSWIIDPTTVQ